MPTPIEQVRSITGNSLNAQRRKTLEDSRVTTKFPAPVAADRALQESLALDDAGSFRLFAETNLHNNVVSEGLIALHSELASKQLQDEFAQQVMQAQTDQERIALANQYSREINKQTADVRTLAYLRFLTEQPPDVWNMDAFDRYTYLMSPLDVKQFRTELSEEGKESLLNIVDDLPAQLVQDGAMEIAGELARLTLVPFQDLMANSIAKEAGLPIDTRWFRTGQFRQEIRNYLAGLSETELLQTVQRISDAFEKAQSDPVYGTLLSDYSVVDFWMGILNEEVLLGRDPEGGGAKLDSVLSTVSTALDYLYVTGVVAKTAGLRGTLRSALTNSSSNLTTRTTAKVGGARGAEVLDMLRNDPNMTQRGIKVSDVETQVSQLPKPNSVIDNIKEVPDTVVARAREIESQADELVTRAGVVPKNYLTPGQQLNVIKEELRILSNVATPVVRPNATTIGLLEDNVGFTVNTLLGASETSGWKRLADVLRTARQLDPEGTNLTIVKKTKSGKLANAFKDRGSQTKAMGEITDPSLNKPFKPTSYNQTNEYFIRFNQERMWHPSDKVLFGDNPVLRAGGITRYWLPPRSRFSPEVSATASRLYGLEQRLVRATESVFKPFYGLSTADKRVVLSVQDWAEDFARNTEKNPGMSDILSQFPTLTEKQMVGYTAYRTGLDAWYSIFNRRLYRDWQGRGFKTAHHDTLPTYHGAVLDLNLPTKGSKLSAKKAATGTRQVYDPMTRKSTSFTTKELEDFYARGGRIMELDIEIDVANKAGVRHKLIKLDPDDGYEIRNLTTQPLKYFPGYSPRFYDDPYFIVKRYKELTVDGVKRTASGGNDPLFSVAIRTAPDKRTGLDEIANYNRRSSDDNVTYDLVYAHELSVQERSASVQQIIHRQGRLFWDERNSIRLFNIDGNPAQLMDPVIALERATSLVARQTASEDWLKSVKGAFVNQYSDLINDLDKFRVINSKEARGRIKNQLLDTTDPLKAQRLREALELWDYIRMMEGVDSDLWAGLRKWALDKAPGLGRYSNKRIEKFLGTFSPIQAIRSGVFTSFMTLRPVRQWLLQSTQVMFLSPLDPGYVLTGRILKDSLALSAGMATRRGLTTGFDDAALAKTMGLKTNEFQLIVKNLDDSGILETVDVHSFAGSVRRWKKMGLDAKALRTRQGIQFFRDHLQRFGFDLGERNNLRFTYLIAVRKALKENNLKSVTQFSPEDWQRVITSTQDMALGMIRPNQFPYQQGVLSLGTQFLSFSHKALISMLGNNPAIKGADAFKIAGGMYLLYGADIFGARDQVRDWLNDNGGEGLSPWAKDVITGGFIDRIFNDVAQAVFDDWKDLDISGFSAPGPDLSRQLGDWYAAIYEEPFATILLGPAGTLGSRLLEGARYVSLLRHGDPDATTAEKFTMAADQIAKGIIPQWNDVTSSYFAYKMDEWYTRSGEPMDLRPTWNTLLAKGIFGINSRETIDYWHLRNRVFDWKRERQNIANSYRDFLTLQFNLYKEGELTIEGLRERTIPFMNLIEDAPLEHRMWIMEQINQPQGQASLLEQFSQIQADGIHGASIVDRMASFPELPANEREAVVEMDRRLREATESANQRYRELLERDAQRYREEQASGSQ
jgi:hypothetical protein